MSLYIVQRTLNNLHQFTIIAAHDSNMATLIAIYILFERFVSRAAIVQIKRSERFRNVFFLFQ